MKESTGSRLAYTAVLGVAMMGSAVLTVLPLWLGALTDAGRFDARQTGWLASADMVGILLATASGPFWVRRVPWRAGAVAGIALFLLANRLSAASTDFTELYALRVLAGLGCGVGYSISLSALGEHARPARAFAHMVLAQTAWGTLGLFLLPRLLQSGGLPAFFDFLDATLLPVLLLTVAAFPSCPRAPSHTLAGGGGRIDMPRVALVMAGTVIYYVAISASWGYAERLGVQGGLEPNRVGEVLSVGFALSALAAPLAPRMVERFGLAPALFCAVAVQAAAVLVLALAADRQSLPVYALATLMLQAVWCFVLPPLIAGFSAADPGGRAVVLCSPSFKLGEIAGPPLAAIVASAAGVPLVMAACAVLLPLGVALLVTADRRGRVAAPAHTGEAAA